MLASRPVTRAHWVSTGATTAGLVLYAAVVYIVVVLLVARLTASSGRAELALTLLAAAVVTLTLGSVRRWLGRWLPASAEARLRGLTVGPANPTDLGQRLDQLTRLVSEVFGAGAQARITASLGGDLTASWRWPRDAALGPLGATTVAHPIARGDRELGRLIVQLPAAHPFSPLEEHLLRDAAEHAALLLETARMDRTLQRVVAESAHRHQELRESRTRILTAMDQERRRVERDIHDGAQQHLVALVINLRLLRVLLGRDHDRARTTARTLQTGVLEAIETLRQLSAGLYPALLIEHGPVRALQAVADSSPVPVLIQADPRQRWSAVVERAAYFSSLEALQNAIKHAGAQRIVVGLTGRDDGLAIEVADDGRGFDPAQAPPGSGLDNLRDRVSAVGGRLTVRSAPGEGTTVSGWLPVARSSSATASTAAER